MDPGRRTDCRGGAGTESQRRGRLVQIYVLQIAALAREAGLPRLEHYRPLTWAPADMGLRRRAVTQGGRGSDPGPTDYQPGLPHNPGCSPFDVVPQASWTTRQSRRNRTITVDSA